MPDSVPSRTSATIRSGGGCSSASVSASLTLVAERTVSARPRNPRSQARNHSSSSSTSNTTPHPTMPLPIVEVVHHVVPERQREPAIGYIDRLAMLRGNLRHHHRAETFHCRSRSMPCGGLTPPALERTVSGVAGGAAGCGAPTIVMVWMPPPVLVNVLPMPTGSNTVPCAVTYGCKLSVIAGLSTED